MSPDLKAYFDLDDKLSEVYNTGDEKKYDEIMDELDFAWFRLSKIQIVLVSAIASYNSKLIKIEQIEEGKYDEATLDGLLVGSNRVLWRIGRFR